MPGIAHVEEEQIRPSDFDESERRHTIIGDGDLVAAARQELAKDALNLRLVVHHENLACAHPDLVSPKETLGEPRVSQRYYRLAKGRVKSGHRPHPATVPGLSPSMAGI